MQTDAPRRVRLARALVPLALAGSLVLVAGAIGPTAQAATVTVSGTVFRDLDNDGVRDSDEPGVAGIRVHRNSGAGTPTTTTDASGHWSLSGLTPGSSGVIQVETGWLRSQCAALKCAAGPGADNVFQTNNQFIQFPLSSLTGARSDLDVGVLPDWPGSSSAAPALQGGAVPANAVDAAARLSWVTSTCSDGSALVCRPGDTYTVSAQIHNEGTTPLTGVQARLALPVGDRFATAQPSGSVTLVDSATGPGVTGMSVSAFDVATRSVGLAFTGLLVPGGLIRVTAAVVAGGTTGTVGCVRGAPTNACPTGEPEGAPLVLAVTHIDQAGDPDSFGPGCTATDIRLCPTGIHDKQVEPDEVDPVGHNVDASVGVSGDYDLTASVSVLSPAPSGGWKPGSSVVFRVSAYDSGPAPAAKGWTLVLLLPKGSAPVVPAMNAVRSCAKTTLASGIVKVTCTGKGPLSPAVTSFAMDVAAKVPTSTKHGTTWPVLAYVAPAAGQPAEDVPLGTAPTSPTADTAATATDNDASAALSVG